MIHKDEEAKKMVTDILHAVSDDGRYPLQEGDQGYYKNAEGNWTAWDNMTGDCWVEDFKTESECLDWLNYSY